MYQRPVTLPFKEIATQFSKKLKKIKVFLCDADGVLTDGFIHWGNAEVGFTRQFHTQDGYGLKMLEHLGIKTGIISGGASIALIKRIETIGITYTYLGNEDKIHAYKEILKLAKVKDHEVLYIGDEIFDIPILERVGFSAAPPHASMLVQENVDYITSRQGGHACVREVIDLLLYAKNIDIKKRFLTRSVKPGQNTKTKSTTKKKAHTKKSL